MNAVAIERDKIRQRERERMNRSEKISLRTSPKQYMQTIVERFNLTKWVGQEEAREKLIQAGYRGQGPYVAFLFFRMVVPVVMFVVAAFYTFFVLEAGSAAADQDRHLPGATYIGMQMPNFFLRNKIQKRNQSINRAFPDALDLLLICVESGMSVGDGVPQGQSGNRDAVDRAGRGIDAADGGTIVICQIVARLMRTSRAASISKRCVQSVLRSSRRSVTARRWPRRCVCWRRKIATCACRRRRRRLPDCRRS